MGCAALAALSCTAGDLPPGDVRFPVGDGARHDVLVEAGAADGTALPDGASAHDQLVAAPACTFIQPKDGDAVKGPSIFVEVQTHNVSAGSIVALLVDGAGVATSQLAAFGKAEFPSVPLPAPSSTAVQLRAEVRTGMSKIGCTIYVTVTSR